MPELIQPKYQLISPAGSYDWWVVNDITRPDSEHVLTLWAQLPNAEALAKLVCKKLNQANTESR